jgi:MFS family permease
MASHDSPIIHPARVLLPLGLGTALSLLGDSALYTVLPTHTSAAGIALAQVGVLLGINRAIRLLLNGPAGLAYSRYPRRKLFISALFIGALSTALYGAARGFWPLLVGRLLWGIAWSGIWVGGATMILDVAQAQERGRWIGLYQTWFFLGTASGSLGGGLLTDWVGYHSAMGICAAMTVLGALIALLFLPETRGCRLPDPTGSARPDRPQPVGGSNAALWGTISMQGIGRFVGAGVISATIALLVQDYVESAGLLLGVATLTGIFSAGRTMLSMISAPLGGMLSDRLGSRWGVMALSVAIGSVGLGLMAWGLPAAIVGGVALSSAYAGSVQSLATTLTGDLVSPRHRGKAIGLLHTSGDLGSAVGPAFAYALLPLVGLRGVYSVCAGLLVANLFLALFFRRRERPLVGSQACRS